MLSADIPVHDLHRKKVAVGITPHAVQMFLGPDAKGIGRFVYRIGHNFIELWN